MILKRITERIRLDSDDEGKKLSRGVWIMIW